MIRKIDFAEDLIAHLDSEATRMKTSLSGLINMVLSGVYAAPVRPLSGPGETSKEEGEGETPESQDPTVIKTEREGSGENSESVSAPDSSEPVPAKTRALRARTRTQASPIPDPPAEIDSSELRAFLPEFVEYRRKVKRSPLAPPGWNLLFNRLKPAGREHAVLALRYSISNNWKSFDVEWLKGKSWATIASELGLSLEAEKPALSPVDLAARDLKRVVLAAEKKIRDVIAPASDGWLTSTRTLFYDGIDACKTEAEVEAHLAACRALCDRLRAFGAFPLRKPTQPGEILPAGGGARIVVDLRTGFICDTICPACGGDSNKGLCLCGDREDPAVGGVYHGEDMVGDDTPLEDLAAQWQDPVFFPVPICGCGTEMVEFDEGHACPVCERDFLANKQFEGRPALETGLSSAELAAIEPPNPDFFNVVSKLPALDVSGFDVGPTGEPQANAPTFVAGGHHECAIVIDHPTDRNLTDELLKVLGDTPVRFGLRQQGHLPTVERMLAEGKNWDEIGDAIGWHGPTAKEWYNAESMPPTLAVDLSIKASPDGPSAQVSGFAGAFKPRQLYPGHPDWDTYQAEAQKRAEPMLDAAIAEIKDPSTSPHPYRYGLGDTGCAVCGKPNDAPAHIEALKASSKRAKVADAQHAYAHNALSGKCVHCSKDRDHIRHYLPQELPFTAKEES